MALQNTSATTNPVQKRNYYQMRAIALDNGILQKAQAMEDALRILREFVLSPKNAETVWLSAKVAHSDAGMTKQECVDCLVHLGRKSAAHTSDDGVSPKADSAALDLSKDIYRQLGMQEWVKYLYFGGGRQLGKDSYGDYIYAEDQTIVMHYFGIETKYEKQTYVIKDKYGKEEEKERRILKCNYSRYLSPMIDLRNKFAGHTNVTKEESLTLVELMSYYDDLVACLKPLTDTNWVYRCKCQEMTGQLKEDFYSALGVCTYQVADVMNMMYTNRPEKWLKAQDQPQLEDLLVKAGMQVNNGTVGIEGELNEFLPALENAWRYYKLCKNSGINQMKQWLQDQNPDEASKIAPEHKTAAALAWGGPADWTELAERYLQGVKGVEYDPSQAKLWFEKAALATSPDPRAMYALGQIYERLDPLKALAWYRTAANMGEVRSQVQLGIHCENGTRKQTRDWKEAVSWYKMAAAQNDPAGLYHLGRCYELGRGISQDYTLAVSYYTQAQSRGNKDGQAALSAMQLQGNGMQKNEQMAIKTLQELAKDNCAPACTQLGISYLKGIGVKANSNASFQYFQQAAKAGDPIGLYYVGLCYEKGIGTQQDTNRATHWYVRAARKGHCAAQIKCANRASLGLRWVRELASMKYTPAQVKLAVWYLEGSKGLTQDYTAAAALLQSAKERSIGAKRLLAECYLCGLGVHKDHQQARTLAMDVAKDAVGKERMCAEGILACSYKEEADLQWITWAQRAAGSGHVSWALQLVEYYLSVYRRSGLEDQYSFKEALKYFELAAKYGNSSIAWALADFYLAGSAYVPEQACTERSYTFYVSGYSDPQRAQYWRRIQHQREPLEFNWRQWNYL